MVSPHQLFKQAVASYDAKHGGSCVEDTIHGIIQAASVDRDAAAQKLLLEYMCPKIRPVSPSEIHQIRGNSPAAKIEHLFEMASNGDISLERAMALTDMLKTALDSNQLEIIKSNVEILKRNLGVNNSREDSRINKMIYG